MEVSGHCHTLGAPLLWKESLTPIDRQASCMLGVDVSEKRKIFFYCFELNNDFPCV